VGTFARLHDAHPEDEAMSQNRVRGPAARAVLTLLGAAAALLAAGAGSARAQTDIVDFNFTGNNGTADPVNATFVATNLVTPVQITRVGPNMAAQSHANSFLGNNWPTSASPVATQDYFSFTVAATSGHAIDLSAGGMFLNVSTQSNGPTLFVVRSNLDNFATNIATPFVPQINNPTVYSISFAPYLSSIGVTSPVGTPIEFRMYAYNAAQTNKQLWLESTATTPNAIRVTGGITPVPEPALTLSAAAAATGLAWLYRGFRRRRFVP
jgi:hypothetical protein